MPVCDDAVATPNRKHLVQLFVRSSLWMQVCCARLDTRNSAKCDAMRLLCAVAVFPSLSPSRPSFSSSKSLVQSRRLTVTPSYLLFLWMSVTTGACVRGVSTVFTC